MDIQQSLVRITDEKGNTLGVGTVVSHQGHILTCAHLFYDYKTIRNPNPPQLAYVQLLNSSALHACAVLEPYWRPFQFGDIAILKLPDHVASQLTPMRFAPMIYSRNVFVKLYGFPSHKPQKGTFGDAIAMNQLVDSDDGPFELLPLTDCNEISRGFSGAPLMDMENKVALGMLSWITKPDDLFRYQHSGFAIPTKTIQATFPDVILKSVGEKTTQVAQAKLTRPGFFRWLLDLVLPWFHRFITRFGLLKEPSESVTIGYHLERLSNSLSFENQHFVDLDARLNDPDWLDVKANTHLHASRFITPNIKIIEGLLQGGDGSGAELATINRKVKPIRNILRFLLKTNVPFVLLGEPGSGKSMALREAARHIAMYEQRKVFKRLVLFVKLGRFRPDYTLSDEDNIFQFLSENLPLELAVLIKPLAQQRRLIVIFDGMDEMSRDRDAYRKNVMILNNFANQYRGMVKTMFACRTNDFSPNFTHRQLVLESFSDIKIQQYLKKALPFPLELFQPEHKTYGLQDFFKISVNNRFGYSIRNPFNLFLYCVIVRNLKGIPKSKNELFHYYFDFRLSFYEKSIPAVYLKDNLLYRILGLIAFLITRRNQGTYIAVRELAPLLELDPSLDLQLVLSVADRCGILKWRTSLDNQDEVVFAHHRFQEYFTAYHLHHQKIKLDWAAVVNYPRWQESMLMLANYGADQSLTNALAQILEQTAHIKKYIDAIKGLETEKEALDKERNKYQRAAPAGEGVVMEVDTTHPEVIRIDQEIQELNRQILSQKQDFAREELDACNTVIFCLKYYKESQEVASRQAEVFDTCLRQNLKLLATSGSPSTQIKLLVHELHGHPGFEDYLDTLLDSDIAWVRNQAIIALHADAQKSDRKGRGVGANLIYDFISRNFYDSFKTYQEVTKAGKWPDRMAFYLVIFATGLIHFIGLAAGLYFILVLFQPLYYNQFLLLDRTRFYEPPQSGWWSLRYYFTAHIAALSLYFLKRREFKTLWIVTYGGIFSFVMLFFLFRSIGNLTLLDVLFFPIILAMLYGVVAAFFGVIHLSASGLVAALCAPFMSLQGREIWKYAVRLLDLFWVMIVLAAIFLIIKFKNFITYFILLPAVGIMSYILLREYNFRQTWQWVTSITRADIKTILSIFLFISALMGAVVLSIIFIINPLTDYISELPFWEVIWNYIKSPLYWLIIGLLALWAANAVFQQFRIIFLRRYYKIPNKKFWLHRFSKAGPWEQWMLLSAITPGSFNESAEAFVEMLLSVEHQLKGDPAASTYWKLRYDAEQALRQEQEKQADG